MTSSGINLAGALMMYEEGEGFKSIYGLIILVRKPFDQFVAIFQAHAWWVKKKKGSLEVTKEKMKKK